jgi:hypothetical protein
MIQTKLSVSTAQALKLGITFQSFFMFIYASLNFGSGCRKNGLKLDLFFFFQHQRVSDPPGLFSK